MAFILLRQSRNTKGFYLVESYRDEVGRSRRRSVCYLGRECDGTDTLEKALAHWEAAHRHITHELGAAKGERKRVLRRRLKAVESRMGIISAHLCRIADREAERQRQREEERHWQAIEQLHRTPSAENAQAAKRAFLMLAKRHHPDQGGNHHDFLRLKAAYDRAKAAWQRRAG